MTKTRTITLTDRPPVRIADADWPRLASASFHDYDGEFDFQANRNERGHVVVRQHQDGRTLVYAIWTYDTAFQNERDDSRRAGVLLDATPTSAQIVDAIHQVHREIGDDEPPKLTGDLWHPLAAECIADLPAETL